MPPVPPHLGACSDVGALILRRELQLLLFPKLNAFLHRHLRFPSLSSLLHEHS